MTTETPRQLAEREAEEAKTALNDWSIALAKCRALPAALNAELETVKGSLRSARLAVVAGNATDEQVATLADRERVIKAEIAEANERIAAVTDQVQIAHAAAEAAAGRLTPILAQAERERIAALVEIADHEIERCLDALNQALARRFEFEGAVHLNWSSIHTQPVRHPYSLFG